jgi:hypothetical protein
MNAIYTIKVTPENVTEYYHFATADNEQAALTEAAKYCCWENGQDAADTAQYVVLSINPVNSSRPHPIKILKL